MILTHLVAFFFKGASPAEVVEDPAKFSLGWRPKDKKQAVEVIEEIADILQPEIAADKRIESIPESKVFKVKSLANKIDMTMEEVIILVNLL